MATRSTPGPRDGLDLDGDDPIHLNETGYKDVVSSALGQAFGAWLIDTTGPTVASITRTGASPTTSQSLGFLVTFSESVKTVVAADFVLDTGGGITGASITGVSGSGTTRTVTVDRGTGDGAVSIDFTDRDTVRDQNLRPAGDNVTGRTDASFTNGQVYTVDTGPPDVSITPTISSPTFENVVPFTATFTESVTGFAKGDIQVAVTGPGAAQVVNFGGSGASYNFGVSVTLSGNISFDVTIPADSAVDGSGVGNTVGSYNGFQVNQPPAAGGDPYLSDGSLGDLLLNSGNTLVLDTGMGAGQPTYRVNGGTIIQAQLIDVGSGALVAKYNFQEVSVPAGVTVTVTGTHPLAIAATEDILWDASVDVSGSVAGRAGGGVGGNGGTGGGGGDGGAGGTGGGGGGPRASGGQGSPNASTDFGNGLGAGQNGGGRNSGTLGSSGVIGGDGTAGEGGDGGTAGFGNQGTPGGSGDGGAKGVAQTQTNRGTAASATGGGGGGGSPAAFANGNPGGSGSSNGADGGNASIGATGGSGGEGSAGVDGVFTANANSLSLAAGMGGGGGGGGGGGAGGQGGGQGGGGSSGAGGGGGGLSWNSGVAQCSTPIDGTGGAGGFGGKGGDGAAGGIGGSAGTGANRGQGRQRWRLRGAVRARFA